MPVHYEWRPWYPVPCGMTWCIDCQISTKVGLSSECSSKGSIWLLALWWYYPTWSVLLLSMEEDLLLGSAGSRPSQVAGGWWSNDRYPTRFVGCWVIIKQMAYLREHGDHGNETCLWVILGKRERVGHRCSYPPIWCRASKEGDFYYIAYSYEAGCQSVGIG